MPETFLIYSICAVILVVPFLLYLRRQRNKDRKSRETAERSDIFSERPRAQHPHIDVSHCIGCQGCTAVCPEGDVLGMVGGKAAVINVHRCIGHGRCAEACPVGAITLSTANASVSADLPYLTHEYETSVPNLFIAGELGGLALIRNAVRQGTDCVDVIAGRFVGSAAEAGLFDVLIVGAGPAGIAASLRAIERKLNYVTLEAEDLGGAVAKYPRQKLVMTTPVEFPLYGSLAKKELAKENLLAFWKTVSERPGFHLYTQERVERIERNGEEQFVVKTPKVTYRARAVILAMGRSGVPRKLGVPGEQLPKVMYRLIEADHYTGKNILIVGGGDSAVEAAMGLAHQKGNRVTISYRRHAFLRIKQRNAKRLEELMRAGRITVIFNSSPLEFTDSAVILDVEGERREFANDYVWIFAGGLAPDDFLKNAGVHFGPLDLTAEVSAMEREKAPAIQEIVGA